MKLQFRGKVGLGSDSPNVLHDPSMRETAHECASTGLEGGLRIAERDAVAQDGIAGRRLRPPDGEALVRADQQRFQRLTHAMPLASVAPDLRERRAPCQRPASCGQQSGLGTELSGIPLESDAADIMAAIAHPMQAIATSMQWHLLH